MGSLILPCQTGNRAHEPSDVHAFFLHITEAKTANQKERSDSTMNLALPMLLSSLKKPKYPPDRLANMLLSLGTADRPNQLCPVRDKLQKVSNL